MAVSVTGILGFGLGAHVYCAWELDSGGGRAGKARRLGVDNDGHPKDEFNCGGAVAKLRFSSTELRYAEPRVKTPVFASSDSRQPTADSRQPSAVSCQRPPPLAFTLRHALHRGHAAQAELDANPLRLAVEYPLVGRFA